MGSAFEAGGIMMWPLLLVGVAVLGLSARAAWLLSGPEGRREEAERVLQAVIFWGAMSVGLGLLGTVIGIIQAAQAIGLAGGVEAPLLWAGIGVALVTLIFGLLIFLVSAVLWFTLRQWAARIAVRERQRPVTDPMG